MNEVRHGSGFTNRNNPTGADPKSNIDITMLTCTYGRPYLLEEAVQSFLRQNIPEGVTTEVLIFNNCPEQKLYCNVPGVRVVNVDQFDLLSDVMNAGFLEARGDWVAILDDDDICLPFRIENSWDFVSIRPSIKALRHEWAWIWERGKIEKRERNLYIGSSFLNREYYFEMGGAEREEYWDISIWNKMMKDGGAFAKSATERKTHFIYRWGGIGFHHSGMADGKRSQKELGDLFLAGVKKDKRFQTGEIEIVPKWKQDYEQLVDDVIQKKIGERHDEN